MARIRFAGFACVFLLAGAVLVCGDEKPAGLRIGLMPACNSIPMVVADARGLFDAQGISVTLFPFNGQLERETALQTGALDGTVSDMINAVQSWTHGFGARVASVTEGDFALLSSPHGSVKSLADWRSGSLVRIRTGLLENSIVYYLTERMLTSAGADLSRLELVPIVQLPARMEMLLAGKIDAACLPEPLATMAAARGAHVLADSDALGVSPGVLLFTKKALAEKRGQIAAFYRAYNGAVDEVNARPEQYRRISPRRCRNDADPEIPPCLSPARAAGCRRRGVDDEKGPRGKGPRLWGHRCGGFPARQCSRSVSAARPTVRVRLSRRSASMSTTAVPPAS